MIPNEEYYPCPQRAPRQVEKEYLSEEQSELKISTPVNKSNVVISHASHSFYH